MSRPTRTPLALLVEPSRQAQNANAPAISRAAGQNSVVNTITISKAAIAEAIILSTRRWSMLVPSIAMRDSGSVAEAPMRHPSRERIVSVVLARGVVVSA